MWNGGLGIGNGGLGIPIPNSNHTNSKLLYSIFFSAMSPLRDVALEKLYTGC
jgi:hypothetical protein